MVKLGFIVEGDTEKILLESADFKNLLQELKLDYIPEIINAEGNGNLLPHNIEKFTAVLLAKGATKIVILTDLDKDACVTETKNRIAPKDIHTCIVSKKMMESWFLADTSALGSFVETRITDYDNPESVENPFEEIRRLRIEKINKGFQLKRALANHMIKHGFSITKAAKHPNCSSAKYFIDKLKSLANQ